mmetsp:Transcript_16168/g.65346  ORF Transcript_16168/g.65346 Transcript_16168/m.65346 type:complete len:130 (+) Transcript_16168:1911-2300(+)
MWVGAPPRGAGADEGTPWPPWRRAPPRRGDLRRQTGRPSDTEMSSEDAADDLSEDAAAGTEDDLVDHVVVADRVDCSVPNGSLVRGLLVVSAHRTTRALRVDVLRWRGDDPPRGVGDDASPEVVGAGRC